MKSIRVRLFALTVPLTLVAMFALAPPASAAAVTASFAGSTVSISGDAGGQDVRVARDLAGMIHVFQNDLEVPVSGGPATLTNTDTVSVTLMPADDLTIDMRQGTFTPGATHPVAFNGETSPIHRLTILGTNGDDVIQVELAGQDLNGDGIGDAFFLFDGLTIEGRGGDDELRASTQVDAFLCVGWADNVVLSGGRGNDYLAGAVDISSVGLLSSMTGGKGDDAVVALECTDFQFLGANTNMAGGGGNDSFTGSDSTLNRDTVSGGAGNDEEFGGDGADVLVGGSGDDILNGLDGGIEEGRTGARFDAAPNDLLDGRTGTDTCFFDFGDTVRHCEGGGPPPKAGRSARPSAPAGDLRTSVHGGLVTMVAGR